MPPYVPGFTAADVRRAFRNDGWIIRQGGRHTRAEKGGLSQTEAEAIAEDEAARENGLSYLPELYAELGLPPPDAPAKAAG